MKYLASLLFVSAFVHGFLAYLVRYSTVGKEGVFDGYGRALQDTPTILRIIFGADSLWSGLTWSATDFVVFWALLFVGYFCIRGYLANSSKIDT